MRPDSARSIYIYIKNHFPRRGGRGGVGGGVTAAFLSFGFFFTFIYVFLLDGFLGKPKLKHPTSLRQ